MSFIQLECGGRKRMSESPFPKAKKLQEAELEAWNYVFQTLESLEKRIKAIEVLLS